MLPEVQKKQALLTKAAAVFFLILLMAGAGCRRTEIPPILLTGFEQTNLVSDVPGWAALTDGSYLPMVMTAADRMTQAWAMKGYPVVYLTARPHLLRPETRGWLATSPLRFRPSSSANALNAKLGPLPR